MAIFVTIIMEVIPDVVRQSQSRQYSCWSEKVL